jgi:GPH family glycoside/pentoside/hexuronide:cation symporter
MMGFVSDRTRTRLGRRRPYLLAGAVPLCLSMWYFFTAPSFGTNMGLAVWATLSLMAFNTFSTVLNIPYSSLTPELTSDYHEQSALNGFRFGFAICGTLIGAAAVQPLVGILGGGDIKRGWSLAGLVLGAVVTLTSLLAFFGTKEKPHSREELPKENFFATYKAVFSNRPFVILIFSYTLHLTAITLLQGIIVYYTKYIYRDEAMATPAMAMLLVVGLVFVPVSVLVSKRIGKKLTYPLFFAILAISTLGIFLFAHTVGKPFFYAVMVFGGAGIGFSLATPFAMVPDTVEWDAARTGSRKEGAYYGMWTFFAKLGAALAGLISGVILSAGGYIVDAVQSEPALLAIRLIIGPIPAAILVAGIILMHFYPLDEKTYESMGKH